MPTSVKIGTRGSQLALWQANWVKSALVRTHSGLSVELVVIKTRGDKITDAPLAKVGGKGLFVTEIEQALLGGRIDLAVHSMKDMPSDIPAGLCIGCVPQRESPADVLISKSGRPLRALDRGSRIGTSSLRRSALLLAIRPDITIVPLRGNLDTRIRKLATGNLDAIILAAAGVKRLGLEDRITEYLDNEIMLPAVGQGALCIETRQADADIASLLGPLNHPETQQSVLGERAFLRRLEGSCQVPVAAFGHAEHNRFNLHGLVADIDGKTVIRDHRSGTLESAEEIGIDLAEHLLNRGADEILRNLKSDLAE